MLQTTSESATDSDLHGERLSTLFQSENRWVRRFRFQVLFRSANRLRTRSGLFHHRKKLVWYRSHGEEAEMGEPILVSIRSMDSAPPVDLHESSGTGCRTIIVALLRR